MLSTKHCAEDRFSNFFSWFLRHTLDAMIKFLLQIYSKINKADNADNRSQNVFETRGSVTDARTVMLDKADTGMMTD